MGSKIGIVGLQTGVDAGSLVGQARQDCPKTDQIERIGRTFALGKGVSQTEQVKRSFHLVIIAKG